MVWPYGTTLVFTLNASRSRLQVSSLFRIDDLCKLDGELRIVGYCSDLLSPLVFNRDGSRISRTSAPKRLAELSHVSRTT